MNRERLKTILRRHEGVRRFPYPDSRGLLTIGVGRNIQEKGVSPDEMEVLLEHDIDEAIQTLDDFLPWWETLDDVRREALCDLAFNMGTRLLSFKRMLANLRARHFDRAADELLTSGTGIGKSLYYTQTGARAEAVAHAIRLGEWD